MRLNKAQLDRALGILPGLACGDALGAGYEFLPPVEWGSAVVMQGGGIFDWSPGEWTDDTSQAILLAETLSKYSNPLGTAALDNASLAIVEWSSEAQDVGSQTRQVIRMAKYLSATEPISWTTMNQASLDFVNSSSRSSGNGSLMRIGGIFGAILEDGVNLLDVAEKYSGITHAHEDAIEACALWLYYMKRAVLEGSLGDLSEANDLLDAGRRKIWVNRISDAIVREPWDFNQNGWVVETFQAALSAIKCSESHPYTNSENEFSFRLEHAVRSGGDTDTVAAVAGALLGGLHGLSAIPLKWREVLHGWPGLNFQQLVELQRNALRRAIDDEIAP